MKLLKALFIGLLFTVSSYAQSNLVFENVIQSTKLVKPQSDSNYTFNFEYISEQQARDFGSGLTNLKNYPPNAFHVFYDMDERELYDYYKLMDKLVVRSDSMDYESVDVSGNFYTLKMPGMIDSTWFFESIRAIDFKEDWIFDTTKFTCEIKSKMYMPLPLLKGKEELGPIGLFYIKPAEEQKNFKPLIDFIITDVYLKLDPMGMEQSPIQDANTQLDQYKTMLLMNSTINRLKSGKLKAYALTIPFNKAITKKEMKTLFLDEFSANKYEKFPVRFKLYNYRFKMVEKWMFDPISLAFKKEALGMILMKRNEISDLTKNENGYISYTFSPVVYVPFNTK